MTEPFTILRGKAVPLLRDNIDTDTISPGSAVPREGRGTTFSEHGSTSLADDLFGNWRYGPAGEPLPDFPLNQPRYQGASILLTGANFGCGSSRESAVWMLAAWGIRCVVAPSFAEIFAANCYANGLLPLPCSADTVSRLAAEAEGAAPGFVVDLARCELSISSGTTIAFPISAYRRRGLLAGLDDIELSLESRHEIASFVARERESRPWIYPYETSIRD